MRCVAAGDLLERRVSTRSHGARLATQEGRARNSKQIGSRRLTPARLRSRPVPATGEVIIMAPSWTKSFRTLAKVSASALLASFLTVSCGSDENDDEGAAGSSG